VADFLEFPFKEDEMVGKIGTLQIPWISDTGDAEVPVGYKGELLLMMLGQFLLFIDPSGFWEYMEDNCS